MNPSSDPTSLGVLVQIWEGLPPEAVDQALRLQAKEPRLRLGQALQRLALLEGRRIAELLRLQLRLRRGHIRDGDVAKLMTFAARKIRDNTRLIEQALRG